MKVAVVGCGYVGLISALGLAQAGHDVVGIDSDATRVERLERGEAPFAEPGVAQALADSLATGHFTVSASPAPAAAADAVLLCVQTPPSASGAVELGPLEAAASTLAGVFAGAPRERRVVFVRSTVPPGTNARLRELLGDGVAVVSNPEFLREGSALADFVDADRIVIGAREPWAADVAHELYAFSSAPVVVTSPETAELAKYASNAFLATLVSFSNELARIGEATEGIDVEDVLGIVHRDRRLSGSGSGAASPAAIVSYLKAGVGYGGSCLPKDVAALSSYARTVGVDARLLDAVQCVNADQAAHVVDLAESRIGSITGRTIAVLGAAFKSGTDDLRSSPGLRVASELAARGAKVVVYDPLVSRERLVAVLPESAEAADTLAGAVADADVCVITTLAPEFAALPELVAARNGSAPLVVDGRRLLDPSAFEPELYLGVGRSERG